MNHHPALGKILLMNVGAHAILYLAFSFPLCGFDATNLFWYRRPSQQRISTSHVLRRSYSVMPHACKWDQCPWIGLLILLADSILPDPHFLLMIPAAYNNEEPLQFLYTPAGDRVPFYTLPLDITTYYRVEWKCTSFPKACDVLHGTPWAW